MISSFVFSILSFALFGLPLFAVMGALGIGLFMLQDIDISAVAIEMYRIANSPTIISIPLFTLAGYFLSESQTPNRLLNLLRSLLGSVPGSLAITTLLLTSIFTAFTGASGITIIALGGLLLPMLREHGYDEKFSLGLITTTGSLGLLLPPSLPIILYGIVAQVDIDQLFMAGIVPCALLVILLAAYSLYKDPHLKKKLSEKNDRPVLPWKEALYQARYELPLPFIILGSLYGGLLTTSETATITLVYVIAMTFWWYKDLSFKKDFYRIVNESCSLIGAILLILCCAMGLTNYLIDDEVPKKILTLFKEFIDNKYVFLLVLNIFLLIIGCLMDIFSAIIVVLPLIIPLAEAYGVHPIHLAIIFLTNLEIGYITPPVGVNLFIASFRFKVPILTLYKVSVPFLIVLLLGLLVITYVPALSLLFQ
jgi:C4-dicarboxylate transporter DctM subunit